MNLWMNGQHPFPKAIRTEGSWVSERWGFLSPTPQTVRSLLGLDPWGRLKHKAVLGYLHFALCQRPPPLPDPPTHTGSLFRSAAGPVKRGNAIPLLSLLDQRSFEGHVCAAPCSLEGWEKREKLRRHSQYIWKHRAQTIWVSRHRMRPRTTMRAKENLA